MILFGIVILALLSLHGVAADAKTHPTVRLPAGLVRGRYCPGSKVKQFLGIPFAKPPTGRRRFMAPEPFTGLYDGVLGERASAACVQFGTYGNSPNVSEDWYVVLTCHPYLFVVYLYQYLTLDSLYLNVYVPAHAHAESKLPIKVFQHGGANVVGSINDPLYNGCTLATDAIVIVFNYRLGPLGFLSLPSVGIEGNMAIKDALLALQWVQSHGALFGGDVQRVMMFGQSAGADNVFVLSSLQEAKPLLSGVVLESGGGIDVIPPDIANYSAKSFVKTLGCNGCVSCTLDEGSKC